MKETIGSLLFIVGILIVAGAMAGGWGVVGAAVIIVGANIFNC